MDVRGVYRHFKGNVYEAIGKAVDKSTNERYVFYRQLYPPFEFWLRPQDMFLGYKEQKGENIQRFLRIADNQTDCLTNVDLFAVRATHSESGETYRIVGQSNGVFIVDRSPV